MIKLSVLGSGSAGNSIVFGCDDTGYWLVDAGLSAKQITLRLEAQGISLDQIQGIFITHEHNDHIGGLQVLLKKCPVKVYASELTQEFLSSQKNLVADWAIFEPGQQFSVGALEVEAIRIPHDATDPVGFLINHGETKVGVFTDFGYVSESLMARLKGVELLYLEANYDVKLLEEDQKRPWSIKQRISSRHGHLSNEQAVELISSLRTEGLQKVAMGHLSQDCNTPECIADLMQALPPELEYRISCQKLPTPWLELVAPPEPELHVDPAPVAQPMAVASPSDSITQVKWQQQNLFD